MASKRGRAGWGGGRRWKRRSRGITAASAADRTQERAWWWPHFRWRVRCRRARSIYWLPTMMKAPARLVRLFTSQAQAPKRQTPIQAHPGTRPDTAKQNTHSSPPKLADSANMADASAHSLRRSPHRLLPSGNVCCAAPSCHRQPHADRLLTYIT